MHMTAQITPKVVTTATEPAAHKSQSGVARIVCMVAPYGDAVTFDERGKQKVLTKTDHSQVQRDSLGSRSSRASRPAGNGSPASHIAASSSVAGM